MAVKSEAPRRVLVAVSSSRSSKDALLWTLDKLVRTPDDILMLLHVLKPIEYIATRDGYVDASQMDPAEVQRIGLQAREVGGELLESFEALCAPKRVEALTKLVEGDRRKMILEEVQRMGATDLVMGGKARRIMPKLKSTSLADYCLKHARCAVTIIRKGHVVQSAPAKPALLPSPSGTNFPTGLASGTADVFTAPQMSRTAPTRPASDKPVLSESDRARWRSAADAAPEEPEPVGDVTGMGVRQQQTIPWGSVISEGGQNGREITPGDEETSSDYMARMIFKARAEELTLALAKLESENDPNVFIAEEPVIEKPVASEDVVAAEPEHDSKKPDDGSNADSASETKEETVESNAASAAGEAEAKGGHVAEAKGEHVAAAPITGQGDESAAKAGDYVAAEEGDKSEGDKSAVADKEVDPNSLSLGDAHIGENKLHLQLHVDNLDSEASIRAHEDSFGDFKSHSSLDNDILNIMAVAKVEGVEKAGEVNGFIQYKRPETPAYARGLEVLEVLDRWLVAKQAEQLRLQTASESGRSTSETVRTESDGGGRNENGSVRSVTEEDVQELTGREAPARSPPEKTKKGGRFSRLFRGRGKKEKGAKAAKADAVAGAAPEAPAAAEDDVTISVSEVDRAVEEFWDDSPQSVTVTDGGPDEPGLLSRIADIIIAEEAEKTRRGDVSRAKDVSKADANEKSTQGRGDVASRKDDVAKPRLLPTEEGTEDSGSVCDEMDRGGDDNMKRMMEEDESVSGKPIVAAPKAKAPERKAAAVEAPAGPVLRAPIPEGLPPAGRVKVKVQMLNREARGAPQSGPVNVKTEARGDPPTERVSVRMLNTEVRESVPTGRVSVQMLNAEARGGPPGEALAQTGVSRRVSRALLEGMVPDMPREDPEEGMPRPEGAPEGPPPDASDAYKAELSKYTLESWLGIGQCVSRFLEDDRSSISSEAYDSVGGSLDTGTPVSLSWDPEPADVAAVQGGHVADDWGYGSSRLGGGGERQESSVPFRSVPSQPVAEPRKEWVKQAVRQYENKGEEEKASGARQAVPEVQGRVSDLAEERNAKTQGGRKTSAGAEAKNDARRDRELRSPFSSYWTAEATTSAPDDVSAQSSAPRFGGIALNPDPRPSTPPGQGIAPLPSKSPDIALPKRQKEKRSNAYDPQWAIPVKKESSAQLRRHPSETELFEEEEQEDFLPPAYQEESTSADPLSALSISQAITDLAASTFADLITDGRISTSQVAAWRDEIAWLTSPGDQVMEMVASTVETRTGSMKDIIVQRLRPDVQTSLPALRSLDDLLQRIVLRLNSGGAASKRELMGTREQTVQVLKAALMINEEVLQEMAVPAVYWASLPKTIKQVVGGDIFQALTSKSANPTQLLLAVNPKTPRNAFRVINNLEAAVHMWHSMMVEMAEPLAKKRAVYASRASALVHDLKMTWPGLEATELAEFKITRNTDIGRAILESYSRALISLCGKTITCLDYLLTMDPPEKSARRSRSRQTPDRQPSPSESVSKSLTSRPSGGSASRRSIDISALSRAAESPPENPMRRSVEVTPKAEGGSGSQQGRGWRFFSRRKSLSKESA